MSRYFYFVFTRPKDGQDAAFNSWYSDRHIYDLVAIPGIAAARRFRLLDIESGAAKPDYLAIYEFDDLDRALSGIAERRGTDRMPTTEAIDKETSRGVVLRPLWDVTPDWRFDTGIVDLAKRPAETDARLPDAAGRMVAHDRQSRPGPAVFDLAAFSPAPGDVPDAVAGLFVPTARLTARMAPITERVVPA